MRLLPPSLEFETRGGGRNHGNIETLFIGRSAGLQSLRPACNRDRRKRLVPATQPSQQSFQQPEYL